MTSFRRLFFAQQPNSMPNQLFPQTFTPGPWFLVAGRILDIHGNEVATLTQWGAGIAPAGYPFPWHHHQANGQLFAAAPDLFAALSEALLRYECPGSSSGVEWAARAKEALAKAGAAPIPPDWTGPKFDGGSRLKTVVYFADGSLEATARHAKVVADGEARYATPAEEASYERQFEVDDAHGAAADSD